MKASQGEWNRVLLLLGFLLLFAWLSLGLGPRGFDLNDLKAIALGKPLTGEIREQPSSNLTPNKEVSSQEISIRHDIVMHLRAPRVLCAVLVGIGLGIAGVAFQAMFRNPLADPYIIGSSSGAALGAAVAVVISGSLTWASWVPQPFPWITGSFLGLTPMGLAALIGSVTVVAVVFAIGHAIGQASSLTLLLSGIAISSLANAIVSLMLYLHNRDAVATIVTWMMGSFADSNWNNAIVMALAVVASTICVWGGARKLDAYALGDRTALSLGLSVQSLQIQMLLAASLVTAFSVASAGIIGFVGLIAPQLARMIVGAEHSKLIPLSGIMGGLLLLIADSIARVVVAPVELPVGIVTAIIGAPFFLFMLLKSAHAVHSG